MQAMEPKMKTCKSCGAYHTWSNARCSACDLPKEKIYYSWSMIDHLQEKKKVTPDELYQMGYDDAKAGKAANASHVHDENYEMGYKDGKGDLAARPVGDNYIEMNDPPDGFVFTEEKRVPEPGEWYLSKNGNAIQAKKARGNNQTRYILLPD